MNKILPLLLLFSPSLYSQPSPFLVIIDGEERLLCNPQYDPTSRTFVFEECPIFNNGFEE